jgi:2-polyprenyl-3-methyl-5-hydroxy-6-metoxy-1,4-benzoquinol methylase
MTISREITYISTPAAVSMADKWYEIATVEHFWIKRRFEVLQKLAGELIRNSKEMAEVGCGNGLLQRQVEDAFGKPVVGCDLNEYALKRNLSRQSQILCYDIFEKRADLEKRFDLVFLFDVLEHIEAQERFLEAIRFHMAPGAHLIINVPAGQWAFSQYDVAAGHVRRYSIKMLCEATTALGFKLKQWSYWGLPLIPALVLRKLWLLGQHDKDKIISEGFDSRNKFIDGCLHALSKCEPISQKLAGTSLLAVFQAEIR